MRMQTTNYLLGLGLLILSCVQLSAQAGQPAKAQPVATKEEKMAEEIAEKPIFLGLPTFTVNTATSLRVEPTHLSDVQIRLQPGMRVEVLDPHSELYWTKIRVGKRVGWAKKHCLDPVSGEFDYTQLLEQSKSDL